MNYDEAEIKAGIIKAMAHPVRLMIIDELGRGDKCVCELLPMFKLNQSTLSRHLSRLKKNGIITEKREGVRVIHHLATPCILQIFGCVMDAVKDDFNRKSKMIKT
ncbi:MAG: metalloregulator ArsR/SmtB family transcription factor [Lentisphaerae bacterium]|nr:metalloregulator ArsR/SmtB family transcription factor [Lentisphaerota bacterium]